MIGHSELILNSDGSIYHLNLLPEDIGDYIITVGDPERVDMVAQNLDSIELSKQKREFKTTTGLLGSKRISIISTGIGTDNIDIVFNELDALANIDFKTRTVKSEHRALTILRIGTSGSINPTIDVDSLLISKYAIGLDALGLYYADEQSFKVAKEIIPHSQIKSGYFVACAECLEKNFSADFLRGITITAPGFYAPQGRTLRLQSNSRLNIDELHKSSYKSYGITNLEMETAGIYLMASALGHKAISLNAILANRMAKKFSQNPENTVIKLIEKTLTTIDSL